MRTVPSLLAAPLRRDVVAGGVAGLAGGLLFWWALQAQGMALAVPGLLGFTLSGVGAIPHLLGSILLGAGFGALLRHQPRGHAVLTSTGLLYGLFWWILGPITLGPLLDGRGPTWSLGEASAAFPSLIGHLLYGGVTGLGFYLLVAAYLGLRPEEERAPAPAETPKRRVVILGGGFGGMSGLEPQHISAPVRAACPHTRFHRGQVFDIDTEAQLVRVRSGGSVPTEELPYDHLVLALGSVPNYFGLPGIAEHSFKLKTLEDATPLRNHII